VHDGSRPKPTGALRFVCLSDTHSCDLRKLQVPEGDFLLHSGDFSNMGEAYEIVEFNQFLGELPHRNKVVIAGNHDFTFD
jgi:3',5'-cyclic AMP phosphodiesterase CpdA